MSNNDEDICLIEIKYDEIDGEDAPDPNKWQAHELALTEMDIASGVCWHPATNQKLPTPRKPNTEQRMQAVRREIAGWFVQSEGRFVPTKNKDSRLGNREIEKLIPQMLAAAYPDDELVERNTGKLTFSALYGTEADPRLSFGVYSGKAYPCPGNPSPRLFREGLWDLNTWRTPAYRHMAPSPDAEMQRCPFEAMLAFAIPDSTQRTMLLDWIAWNLQNEGNKPNWAVMLYSETKGTGKSTIAKILTALFGLENTASTNGIRALTQRFAADTLDRKLVVAEEVHISSHSTEGNALKDLITNNVVSVERKYQPIVTIPQTSCFLFMTNHKPLWLEGGERRYYIIQMDHSGHAQGDQNEVFSALAGTVNEQANNPQFIRDLYQRLMLRELSAAFDPKNLGFSRNATPIMRELQANSGNEGEEVLASMLAQYNVQIILSPDFPELVAHLRLRNVNSLRNLLAKLGWEARRISFGGVQYRAWCVKGLRIDNGRVDSPKLAQTYSALAEASGYTWFDLAFAVDATWKRLWRERLSTKRLSQQERPAAMDNSEGNFGPFRSSTSHLRLQARTPEEMSTGEKDHNSTRIYVLGR
jgi:hypothetical protein